MNEMTDYKGKKVLVLGLARSGMNAAKLLNRLGAFVTVNDQKPMTENKEAQELVEAGIEVVAGKHDPALFKKKFDFVVKNPGIPYTNEMVQEAERQKIPVITDIDFASRLAPAEVIAITGTNGKTTTTLMVGAVLNEGGKKARLAGNIGYPVSEVVPKLAADEALVLETSSFQLKGTQNFHPHIAAITNLYEAHIDYHQTREDYVASKWKIQAQMTAEDYLILNYNQEECRHLAQHTKATVLPFCTKGFTQEGAYYKEGMLYFKDEVIMKASELGVPGSHNIENALIAIAVGKLCGLTTASIRHSLQQFKGAKHRLQYVDTKAGVAYYNDSKATNRLAMCQALSGFEKNQLTLIIGGLDRGEKGEVEATDLVGIHNLICFGETKERMKERGEAAGIQNIWVVDSVREAVALAYQKAKAGEQVLLSPAHASWDQYHTFEERGDDYISCVEQLEEDKNENCR